MILNTTQWHVRLYLFAAGVYDNFFETYTRQGTTNLCQYIRMIFLWLPLIILAYIAFLGWVLFVLLYYPITRFGGTGTTFGYLSLVAIVAFIALCAFLSDRRKKKAVAKRRLGHQTEAHGSQKEHSLAEVIWLSVVAAKNKVCPMIEINDNSTKEGA